MSRTLIVAFAVAGLFAGTPLSAQQRQQAGGQPKGEPVTLTADVIDLSCKFVNGASGDAHRQCAQVCAGKGQPLALLASDGNIYIPVNSGMGAAGENARLREYAERRVRVRGRVIQQGAIKVIVIDNIETAS
ncbi:MAG: hypothetical protein ACREMN_12075 [Gemmatimonadales bacterium]